MNYGRVFETPPAGDRSMDLWILWAREEMERRLHEPCILEHLATAMDLTLARFRGLFAEAEGIPADEYLYRLRLARAKVLLERTFLSVAQVMALVGLSNARQFADDFKQTYGVRPQDLREQVWGGGAGQP
jgi:transcriptional regulator GlxA family with amidase domain